MKAAPAAKSAGVRRSKLPCGLRLLYSALHRSSEPWASLRSMYQCSERHSFSERIQVLEEIADDSKQDADRIRAIKVMA